MEEYRNARVKLSEIFGVFLLIPLAMAAIPMFILWQDGFAFIATFAFIYFLVCFNVLFFWWDTRKIPHTVHFDEEGVVLRMRSYEVSYRWKDVAVLMWKPVLSKRSVVGLFMADGGENWVRSVNPRIARKMESSWQKWKKV